MHEQHEHERIDNWHSKNWRVTKNGKPSLLLVLITVIGGIYFAGILAIIPIAILLYIYSKKQKDKT